MKKYVLIAFSYFQRIFLNLVCREIENNLETFALGVNCFSKDLVFIFNHYKSNNFRDKLYLHYNKRVKTC